MENLKQKVEFDGKIVYEVDDSRYSIDSRRENDKYIAWYELGLIDKGWGPNQYDHIIKVYNKKIGTIKTAFSITDKRVGTHYTLYLREITGDILKLTVTPDSDEEFKKKEINLENLFA